MSMETSGSFNTVGNTLFRSTFVWAQCLPEFVGRFLFLGKLTKITHVFLMQIYKTVDGFCECFKPIFCKEKKADTEILTEYRPLFTFASGQRFCILVISIYKRRTKRFLKTQPLETDDLSRVHLEQWGQLTFHTHTGNGKKWP